WRDAHDCQWLASAGLDQVTDQCESVPAELSGGSERGIRVMSETYAQARHRIAMTPIPLEVVRRRLLNRGRHRMTWAEYAERGRSSIRGKQNNAISNRADWVRGKSGCF